MPPRFCREPIVLASESATRRAMLEAAGLALVIDKPDIDEDALKLNFKAAGLGVGDAAVLLATAKAEDVQSRHPGRVVIGADQMLDCAGDWFDKPADRAAAVRQLTALSGRTHRLISAVVAVQDGTTLWSAVDEAELTMRPLSPEFIESYLDAVGDRAFASVGGYQVEGPGVQLFSAIQGNHFTILGLPLLPLLDFLRRQGVVES